MNIKIAAIVIALVGFTAMAPSVEAKPKFYNNVGNGNHGIAAGGCYQNNGHKRHHHKRHWKKSSHRRDCDKRWQNNNGWRGDNRFGNNNRFGNGRFN